MDKTNHREVVRYIPPTLTREDMLRVVCNAGYLCPFTMDYIDEEGLCSEKDCKKAKQKLSFLLDHIKTDNYSSQDIDLGLDNVDKGIKTARLACLNSSDENPTSCGTAQDTLDRVRDDLESAINKMKSDDGGMDHELYKYTHGIMYPIVNEQQIPEIDPSEQKDLNPFGSDILDSMRLAYEEALESHAKVLESNAEVLKSHADVIAAKDEIIEKQKLSMEQMFEFVKSLSATAQVPNQYGDPTVEHITAPVPPEQEDSPFYHE